jgi:hypothetical protein
MQGEKSCANTLIIAGKIWLRWRVNMTGILRVAILGYFGLTASASFGQSAATKLHFSSAVTITSTPSGAEIFIDQNFVGNTPSSINLGTGKHWVSIQKTRFKQWRREITLSPGTINLNAELAEDTDVSEPGPSTRFGDVRPIQSQATRAPAIADDRKVESRSQSAVTTAYSQLSPAEQSASLKASIAAVDVEIRATEADDEKYEGGLVKALIESRLAILRQTHAMLDQRAKALNFGIALKFTVDGQTLVLPPTAKDELVAVEREIVALDAGIARQQAEADRYSGGLVQALALSTVATSRQTRTMLEQKRLAIQYGLPQYLGFVTNPKATTTSPSTTAGRATNPGLADDWDIVSVNTRVTESNSTWSKFAWKLILRNKSDRSQQFEATIEFHDKDGFIVDTSDARGAVTVPPRSEETFTGFALVTASVAGNVASSSAKVHMVNQ